jgi:hypothetical protein
VAKTQFRSTDFPGKRRHLGDSPRPAWPRSKLPETLFSAHRDERKFSPWSGKSWVHAGQHKGIIGFGCIWGLFFFGGMLLSSFTLGANDSAPEVLAILLNGLTILPSCICAIWFMRYAALWLMFLSAVTAFGLVYQQIHSSKPVGDFWGEAGGLTWALIVAAIPAAIGILLFRRQGEAANRLPVKSGYR